MLASADDSVSVVPNGKPPPARHANSHSASVGSRKPGWLSAFSRRMNCWTSNQLTFSTGQRGPQSWNWLGLCPMTRCHSAWVTS